MFNLLICIILKIIDCCTIWGNYSLLFVTKLQRISHFKFEFFLLSSNFLVPPFYPSPPKKRNIQVGQIIRIILVSPLSSVNLRSERSQRGSEAGGAWASSVRNPPPLSPQMKWQFLQGSRVASLSPGQPPPPLAPLILKRLATLQLMRHIKTSLSLNMDIRDNYYLDLYTIFMVYLLYITCKPLRTIAVNKVTNRWRNHN